VREIFRSTVRARGLRPAPLVLGALLLGVAGLMGWADGRLNPMTIGLLAAINAFVVSAGLIGSDVADGTVQLLLVRPVTRNQYLAGRFLGALTLALSGALLIVAANAIGCVFHGKFVFDGAEAGGLALTVAADLVWQVAFCFALSTFVPGRGDVIAYVALWVSSRVLVGQAADVLWPWLAAALQWWEDQMMNDLFLSGGLSPAFWHDLPRWSSNLAFVLFLGAAVFHRREFSYGSG
jgi:hypothetical protein